MRRTTLPFFLYRPSVLSSGDMIFTTRPLRSQAPLRMCSAKAPSCMHPQHEPTESKAITRLVLCAMHRSFLLRTRAMHVYSNKLPTSVHAHLLVCPCCCCCSCFCCCSRACFAAFACLSNCMTSSSLLRGLAGGPSVRCRLLQYSEGHHN
jgi:hypothetical protein